MSIIDRFLGIKLDEDFTDTSWWADAVFRALEQEAAEGQGDDFGTSESAMPRASELI